ncbi:unnamed protein product, partial [Linum tenue]
GGNLDGELLPVASVNNLDEVEPQEQEVHHQAFQIAILHLLINAADRRLVLKLDPQLEVIAVGGEAASAYSQCRQGEWKRCRREETLAKTRGQGEYEEAVL